jgi:hypothetical protein
MKNLFLPFKAIFSLGWLGLVLLLLAGSILWALDSQESEPFDAAQERMTALSMLENDLPRALNQMKLYEARKIFSLKYDQPEEQDYARLAQESDAEVSAILTEMEEAGHLDSEQTYVADILTEITAFNQLRETHRATFDALVEAYQADDQDRINDLADQFEIENEDLDFAQRDMVIEVEQGRLEAKRDFPEDINDSILIATGGLALSLVLALVGFQLIAAAVRPLGTLRNAITAIAGDQYRPESISGLLKARGPAGKLARALDHLSTAVQQRDSGLKAETERLRQALYESRRRRLKIYHPEAAAEEQS